jgi:hypothetical protein
MSLSVRSVEPEPVAGVLNVGGIGGARRRDCVDTAAGGATANHGCQYKGGVAPLANCGKATIGEFSPPQGTAVGLRHKLHQFPPLRKRPANPMPMPAAASTS